MSAVRSYNFVVRGDAWPAIPVARARASHPFYRYAVMPVARNVWAATSTPTDPAADARRLIHRQHHGDAFRPVSGPEIDPDLAVQGHLRGPFSRPAEGKNRTLQIDGPGQDVFVAPSVPASAKSSASPKVRAKSRLFLAMWDSY